MKLKKMLILFNNRFDELINERTKLKTELNFAPDLETLQPQLAKLEKNKDFLEENTAHQMNIQKAIGILEYKKDEIISMFNRLIDLIQKTNSENRKIELARKSINILRSYKNEVIKNRLEIFANGDPRCFFKSIEQKKSF